MAGPILLTPGHPGNAPRPGDRASPRDPPPARYRHGRPWRGARAGIAREPVVAVLRGRLALTGRHRPRTGSAGALDPLPATRPVAATLSRPGPARPPRARRAGPPAPARNGA